MRELAKIDSWVEYRSGRLMSVHAVALDLKCTTYEVEQLIRDGLLDCIKLDGVWFVTKTEFIRYKNERSKKMNDKTSTNSVPWTETEYLTPEQTKDFLKGKPAQSGSQVARRLADKLTKIPPGGAIRLNFPKKNMAYRVQNQARDAAVLAGWYDGIPENDIGDWLLFRTSVKLAPRPEGGFYLYVVHLDEPRQSHSVTMRRNKIKKLQAKGLTG